jgi:hypothetical protein
MQFRAMMKPGLAWMVLGAVWACSTYDAGVEPSNVDAAFPSVDAPLAPVDSGNDAAFSVDSGPDAVRPVDRDATGDAMPRITSVDLRDYFPKTSTTKLHRRRSGSYYSRYTVFPADADFQTLYDTYQRPTPPLPGKLMVWQKAYYNAEIQPPQQPFVATYAQLFFGDDKSITEAGDYLVEGASSVAFGYRRNGQATGLLWSGAGGLVVNKPARIAEIFTAKQDSAGAYLTSEFAVYSHVELIDVIPAFSPKYGLRAGDWVEGGGKTYTNVAHIIFHHGVRNPGQTTFKRCPLTMPLDAYSEHYRSEPNYNSYASDYYLAPGLGLVQEGFLYNEQNSYFDAKDMPGSADCTGSALIADRSKAELYNSYIEDP